MTDELKIKRTLDAGAKEGWLPQDVDLAKASAARAYDYFLGGAHNFEVDRDLGRKVEDRVPNIRAIAQDNRSFLRRAVGYCIDQGVRQFLDLGSGIPTVGNVHEIAQQADPDARVVYVDNEPVAVAHSLTMLEENDRATMVYADVTDPDAVLDAAERTQLLDFDQPIGVMMVALLHFIPERDRPAEVVRRFHARIPRGSYFCFSHLTADDCPELTRPIVELYEESSNPLSPRTYESVSEMVSDFEFADPGLVYLPSWHPDSPEDVWEHPERSVLYGGVGVKR